MTPQESWETLPAQNVSVVYGQIIIPKCHPTHHVKQINSDDPDAPTNAPMDSYVGPHFFSLHPEANFDMPTKLKSRLWSCSELVVGMSLAETVPHEVKAELTAVDESIEDWGP